MPARVPATRILRRWPTTSIPTIVGFHRIKNMKPQCLFFSCLVSFGMAASGHAQGFRWSTASASSMAMGGVYVPSQGEALDALAANPAGLTFVGGRTIDLGLTSIFARG